MSQELKGVVERLTEKGFVCSGTWVGYSKFFQGDRIGEADLGRPVVLEVHEYRERMYLDRVASIGEKDPSFKAPHPAAASRKAGSGAARALDRRSLSPETVTEKTDESRRIAASVAVRCAVDMAARGVTLENIRDLVPALSEFILSGVFPACPSGDKRGEDTPTRMNNLFVAAKAAKIVADWPAWQKGVSQIVGRSLESIYDLTSEEVAKVEAIVRLRTKAAKSA